MRNQSGEILRRVAGGETIQVTNHGEIAALIVPPGADPLSELAARGQVRSARRPVDSLRSVVRGKGGPSSEAIVAGIHAPLRSHDAIHLAVALRVGCEEIVTYDAGLDAAAAATGLSVLSPGDSHPR